MAEITTTQTMGNKTITTTINTAARGPAGSDANVTQANMEAAITDKPGFLAEIEAVGTDGTGAEAAAFREAIQSGDTFAGVNYLPLTVSKVWKENRIADTRPPLNVLLWGDSLTEGINTFELIPNQRFCGYKLMRPDRAAVSEGAAPLSTDGVWLHNQYRSLAASTTVEWAPPGGAIGTTANRVGVLYYKGASSANTFQLQYSQNNGGSWSNAGAAIDTSQASANVAWFEFVLSNTGTNTRVRVVTSVGQTVKIIGCGIWFGDTESYAGRAGFVIIDAWQGNIGPSLALSAVSSAIKEPLAAMQVNMILGSWYDLTSDWSVGGTFDQLKTALDAAIVADWVFVTPNPMGPGASSLDGSYTSGEYASLIRTAMIDWAERHDQNILDLYPRWGSWENALAIGMVSAGDEVHPNDNGDRYKQWFIGDLISQALYRQANSITLRGGPNGRPISIYVDEYAIRSEADATSPLATLLWYHTGPFTATGAITSTGDFTASSTALFSNASVSMTALPTYADNAAAVTGGLVAGRVYKTATGELRIRV
jgi:hypothetical protein